MKLTKIPRNIFQTWETKDISDGFKWLTQTWWEKNANYAYFLRLGVNDCLLRYNLNTYEITYLLS
jgi:hypothetical protein